jgi:hypothetical protein
VSTLIVASELLSPRTDAGALAQVIGVIAVTMIVALLVRRERSVVMLTVGAGLVLLGVMALRTLH